MTSTAKVTIRDFRPGDEAAFRDFNEEWIVRYFRLEPKDRLSLDYPQSTILDRGGKIFIAEQDNHPVGCCALLPLGPGEFEVAKMAVAEASRGGGIGRQLLKTIIDAALAAGAHRLYIETNQKLVAAVRLYESLGFRHLPPERITPSPYARANVYMERYLDDSL